METFIKNKLLKVLLMGTAVWATACSDVAFSPDPNAVEVLEVPDGYMLETFGFSEQDTRAKVDILFVVDNSGSMTDEQIKLGPALASFLTSLARIDWQIGITTTDVSNGPHGVKGTLVPFKGTSTRILNKNVPNYAAAFSSTVVRDELVGCSGSTCPSSDERPLEAIVMAVNKRNTENSGFFRSGADLATVILSDEDEGSTGTGTSPATVLANVVAAFGTKTYTGFGIVIKPGDTACYNSQTSSVGQYGTYASGLALLTQGLLGSICDADYGPALASIGQRVREMVKSITLRMMPNPDTLQIRIRPFDPNLTWTIEGQTITFNTPPKPGTRIDIMYLPF
jgi:hypothetical protein